MTSDLQVSVILPYYEGERWIGRSAASVLSQAAADFELIIVEDGSAIPDGAADGPLSNPRVRRFRIPHAGKGAALNFGAGQARADLLCFIDQDDIMMPGRLQRQVRAMRSDGAARCRTAAPWSGRWGSGGPPGARQASRFASCCGCCRRRPREALPWLLLCWRSAVWSKPCQARCFWG